MSEHAPRSGLARFGIALAILFTLYQSVEGIGQRLLGNQAVQGALLLAFLFSAWALGKWVLRDGGWQASALDRRKGALVWFAACFALAVVAKLAGLALGTWGGVYVIDSATSPAGGALAGGLALAALVTFLPSIAEDILTRGLWWRQFGSHLSTGAFIAVSALVYVLNHIYRLGKGPSEWLMLACFGLAYALALVRSGSLWAAVGLHWGWNFTNAVLDLFITVDGNPALGPYISTAAHLGMALIVQTSARWISPSLPIARPDPCPRAEPESG